MSGVQFGRWNFDGRPIETDFIYRSVNLTAKYAADVVSLQAAGPIALSFQPFCTTTESNSELQPVTSITGLTLTWDGRLDNRNELMAYLNLRPGDAYSDARIALTAYERWGQEAFAKLLGDWSLALWNSTEQTLLLGKDFLGARSLYYFLEPSRITWCSVLDPLVLLAERSFEICEEFVAGYLSTYPATQVTPFVGIRSVQPSTFLRVKSGAASTQEHWRFDSSERISYRTDGEYEEHFRQLFAAAVRRRLRSSRPVLAELSGGRDSSSIVAIADQLLAQGSAEAPRLDTVSCFDDDEPNWNERPYFSLIEQKRRRPGYHLNVGRTEGAFVSPAENFFFPSPGYDLLAFNHSLELNRCLESSCSRVLIRGVGGDEFLGGRPTPIPELQDLATEFDALKLARQLTRFSRSARRPYIHLAFDAFEGFLPQRIRRRYKKPPIASWLTPDFVARNQSVFWAALHRTEFFGPRPSVQTALQTLDHLRRQLNCSHPDHVAKRSVTYPYLDRDLLLFLFAVPREQLVRPGEARSLMRRALRDLVPSEILNRKRKAYVARRPITLLAQANTKVQHLLESPRLVENGWMEPLAAKNAICALREGKTEMLVPMLGTLKLELWLRSLDTLTQSSARASTGSAESALAAIAQTRIQPARVG